LNPRMPARAAIRAAIHILPRRPSCGIAKAFRAFVRSASAAVRRRQFHLKVRVDRRLKGGAHEGAGAVRAEQPSKPEREGAERVLRTPHGSSGKCVSRTARAAAPCCAGHGARRQKPGGDGLRRHLPTAQTRRNGEKMHRI
jgi:hypothetical protein